MLSIPKSDETSYEDLVQKARLLIPHIAPEWTDLNDHDPGITTLQTLAWLVDNLNYYINATGEIHRLKYLQLLGISPKREPSKGFITLSHKYSSNDFNIKVDKGTKFIAGEVFNGEIGKDTIVFESIENFSGKINPYTAFYRGKNDSTDVPKDDNIYPFIHAGQSMSLFSDNTNSCYIKFNLPLAGEIRFYMDIGANPHRKPYDDFSEAGFPKINLQWSYWDDELWKDVTLIIDETYAFRTNGFITLRIPHSTTTYEDETEYYLRVTLNESEREYYDELPQLCGLYTDCIKVEQTNTISGLKFYKELPPSERLEWRNPTLGCAKERRWLRNFPNVHILTLSEIPLPVPDEEKEQEQEIDIIEVWLEQQRSKVEWTEREIGVEKDCDAPVFYFNRDTGEIILGDGIDGKQPTPRTCLVPKEIITSLWDKGNVRAGQIKTWYKDSSVHAGFEDNQKERLLVMNPQKTTGGINNSTFVDLENELSKKLRIPKRAVTKEDYIHIVKETPGLMIDNVTVINSAMYTKCYGGIAHKNTIYIVVKPYVDSDSEENLRSRLKYWYRDVIYKYINKFRLIATDIQIISANYVRIEVSFFVRLFQDTEEARAHVTKKLKHLIDLKYRKQFGGMIVYSQIFSEIEQLSNVAEVMSLELFCDGIYAEKNEQGNILVNPDTITYLDDNCIYGQFTEMEGTGE